MLRQLFFAVIAALAVSCTGGCLADSRPEEPALRGPASEDGEVRRHVPLVGRVVTRSGDPVAGASVGVRSLDEPAKDVSAIGIMTDGDGHYRWIVLPGRYEVTVWKPGFARVSQTVEVQERGESRLDFVVDTESRGAGKP